MTPNSFPNLASLDTIAAGASVSSWLWLGCILSTHCSIVCTVVVSQLEAALNK